MPQALEAAVPFILLFFPGILPLLFLAHYYLLGASATSPSTLAACLCVSLLAPLATLSASFGIVALTHDNSRSLHVAQNIVQCFVELGYRIAVLCLIVPSFALVGTSPTSVSSRDLCCHNILLLFIILIAFLFSLLHSSISLIPNSVACALSLAAALLPIPLLVHLGLSTPSERVRHIWSFAVILQLLSAVSLILRIPLDLSYAPAAAICTILWGSGVLVLFYALLSTPLPPPATPRRRERGAKFALLTPAPAPAHLHRHTRSHSSSAVAVAEDFTSLRDPFASPPPISPAVYSRPQRPPTPTPMRREVLEDGEDLANEALLSQILLRSLMRDTCAECSSQGTVRDIQCVHEDPQSVEMQPLKIVHTVPVWWRSA